MEKKNMVLLTVIAVATLLVAVVGATFAYFTATVTDERSGQDDEKGQANIGTATTPGSITIKQSKSGFGKFDDQNVLPGHKDLMQIVVESPATNTNDTYFNIVYEGTNTFPEDAIKFQIYESTEDLGEVTETDAFNCEVISESGDRDGEYKMHEKCEINPTLKITTSHPVVTEGVKPKNYGESDPGNGNQSAKTVLNGELPFVITGNASKKTMYYYIVVEYVNKESDPQDSDIGKSLEGKIGVEMTTSKANAIKDTDDSKLNKKEG